MDGDEEAFVTLAPGISARDVVGHDLFAGFDAGSTPDDIAKRLGQPARVESEGDWTLMFYDVGNRRVALASRMVAPSGGGPRRRAYELRAFPQGDFAAGLPVSLRELIRDEQKLRRVVLVSDAASDHNIRLYVREGRVTYVAAASAEQ
jgi:hypothetical protein